MANTRKMNRKASRKASKKTRKQDGGRRKSAWNIAVKRVFDEMRRKDRKASFGDALKEASRRKQAGEF